MLSIRRLFAFECRTFYRHISQFSFCRLFELARFYVSSMMIYGALLYQFKWPWKMNITEYLEKFGFDISI